MRNLVFGLSIGLLISLSACGKQKAYQDITVTDAVAAWVQTCAQGSPSQDNVQSIADKYSLRPFSQDDQKKETDKLASVEDRVRVLLTSRGRASPQIGPHDDERDYWWFNQPLGSYLRYSKRTFSSGPVSGVEDCTADGFADSYSQIADSIKKIGSKFSVHVPSRSDQGPIWFFATSTNDLGHRNIAESITIGVDAEVPYTAAYKADEPIFYYHSSPNRLLLGSATNIPGQGVAWNVLSFDPTQFDQFAPQGPIHFFLSVTKVERN